MIILIHSSKTMHHRPIEDRATQVPVLLPEALRLHELIKKLSATEIAQIMQVSPKLATATKQLITDWNITPADQTVAIDSFAGDIYSGLQTHTWSEETRVYASQVLYILSGLYGLLRPLDTIYPYRLEMGFRFPASSFITLYKFWGDKIASQLPEDTSIINLASIEYSKTITPFFAEDRIITPKFLTTSPTTKVPTFVAVHAKIARGAYANWLLQNRVRDTSELSKFADLGYEYDADLSKPNQPIYVCKSFGGLGLSVRLRE